MPTRVLVTDVEERAALAVCRGLAAAGYVVSGVAGATPAAGHWSRAVRHRFTLPNPRVDADGFVSGLAEIAARGEHDVLVACVDATTLAVSANRELFERHLLVGLPPHDVVLRCLDKPSMLAAATAAGLPPPPGATVGGVEEAIAEAARLGYPVVVKPTRSLAAGLMRTTAYADDEQALRELLATYRLPVTVQRCESGPVLSLGGVVHAGELLGLCASRDLRMWPPRGGFTSASRSVAAADETVAALQRLLADLGWQGIFQLELVETRAGLPAAIDFNPRPYGSLALALAAGANLPATWVDALVGRGTRGPVVARPGVGYRWEETEILNALSAVARGDFLGAARIAVPRRGTTHAFLQVRDPAPLAARALGILRRRLLRRAAPARTRSR